MFCSFFYGCRNSEKNGGRNGWLACVVCYLFPHLIKSSYYEQNVGRQAGAKRYGRAKAIGKYFCRSARRVAAERHFSTLR